MGLMHKKALWVTLMSGTARFTDAQSLLRNELDGLAIDFTSDDRFGSTGFYGDVAIKDRTTPANVYNSSPTTTASSLLTYTSPSNKLVLGPQTPGSSTMVLRYPAHNLCLWSQTLSNAAWTDGFISNGTRLNGTVSVTNSEGFAYCSLSGATSTVTGASYVISAEVTCDTTIANVPLRITFDSATASTLATFTAGVPQQITFSVTATASSSSLSLGIDARDAVVPGGTNATGYNVTFNRIHIRRTPSDSTYLATTTASRFDLPIQFTPAGVQEGLLVEEARTNLETQSQNFDGATFWIGNSGSVSGNAALAPDGTTTAGLYTPTAGLGVKLVYSNSTANATVANATVYTLSFFIKISQGTARYVQIGFGTTFFGANTFANFDLQTGAVGTVGATATSSSISFLGNGWYRCVMTATSTGAGAEQLYVGLVGSGSATRQQSYAASVTDTIAVWGAQVEAGSFPTSYIQTFASTVTRAADSGLTLATSAYPHSATVNSGWIEYVPSNVATAMVALRWDDGTNNEVVSVGHSAAAALGLTVTDGGAAQTAPLTSGTATANATERVAFSWKANDFLFSDNGAAAVADTSGTLPTVTSLDFGPTLTGLIKRVVVVPVEKDATEVAAMATA